MTRQDAPMTDKHGLTGEIRDELELLIATGVSRAFRDIGLNQEEVFELRKDLNFLRDWRVSCETMRQRGTWAIITVLVTGVIGLIIMGIRSWVGGGS